MGRKRRRPSTEVDVTAPGIRPDGRREEEAEETVVLEPELLGPGVVDVLPSRRKQRVSSELKRRGAALQRSRKREKRDAERLAQKKLSSSERRRSRAELMAAVARNNLPMETLSLLRPTSALGVRKGSLRTRLKAELARSRHNLPPGEDASRLLEEKDVHPELPDEEEDDTGHHVPVVDRIVSAEAPPSPEGTPTLLPTTTTLRESTSVEKTTQRRDPTETRGAAPSLPVKNDATNAVVVAELKTQPIVRTVRTRARRLGKMTTAAARELLGTAPVAATSADGADPNSMSVADVKDWLRSELLGKEGDDEVGESSEEDLESAEEGGAEDPEDVEAAGDGESDDDDDDDEEEAEGEAEGLEEKDGGEGEEAEARDVPPGQDQTRDGVRGRGDEAASVDDAIRKKHTTKLVVHVQRPADLAEKRLSLPICEKEQEVMEAVLEEDVVVVIGATGTGKTTQVPQFLFEAGFGDPRSDAFPNGIVVTQPRRVAAISCATRVAAELGTPLGGSVGYQVRHRANVSGETRIKFATDGVLLREVEEDLLLRRYSAVVVDEAHERSVDTDLLLTLLSRSVQLRRRKQPPQAEDGGGGEALGPLKVIIMSATLDVEELFGATAEKTSPLFRNYRVVEVNARQFPVTAHFAKRTHDDYVHEAFKKVLKIHRRLPPGGVLVFVTGRLEVEDLCRRLTAATNGDGRRNRDKDVVVLPLYAMLPEPKQRRVFAPVRATQRKVVVATNVAETSITIPDVRYVVDTGRAKERVLTHGGLVSSFEVRWISQSSAQQRMGRAGRTGPGHCYRLYSSAVFQHEFAEHPEPEIRRVAVDSLVLRLRAMGIVEIMSFPLPTKPAEEALQKAHALLQNLEAVNNEVVTPLGETLAMLPVPPRSGKLLIEAAKRGCLRYAARIAASLGTGELLDRSVPDASPLHARFRHEKSELLTSLRVLCAAEYAVDNGQELGAFCQELGLLERNVRESIDIAIQLEDSYRRHVGPAVAGGDGDSGPDSKGPPHAKKPSVVLAPPSLREERHLLEAIVSAFPDQVARRLTSTDATEMGIKPSRRYTAFLRAPFAGVDDVVFLSTSSGLSPELDYVVYADILAFTRRPGDEAVKRISGASMAERQWIGAHCSALCTFGSALAQPSPFYDPETDSVRCYVRARYGSCALGILSVEYCDRIENKNGVPTRFVVFAQALLDDRVVPGLKANLCGGGGATAVAGSNRSLQAMSAALAVLQISSRRRLIQQWSRNPTFLRREYLTLVADEKRAQVVEEYPPIARKRSPPTRKESDVET